MRRAGLLATVGVLLVTAVWWMFLISPKNGQIADLEDELNVAIDSEQRLRVQINQLETIRQAEVEYLAALGRLDALIPERPLLEDFIEQVYQLANDTGVELQALAPGLPTASDDSELREVAVVAQIQGEFFEVLGFLFGLNDMERLVRVDSVSVSSSADDSGNTVLAANVEMKLFTLADLLPILEDAETIPPEESSTTEDGAGDVEAVGIGS